MLRKKYPYLALLSLIGVLLTIYIVPLNKIDKLASKLFPTADGIDSSSFIKNSSSKFLLETQTSAEDLFKLKKYDDLFKYLDSKDGLIDSPREMGMLGFLYLHGFGVKKSASKARKWLIEGHEAGDDQSTCLLGYTHEKGLGTKRSVEKAFHFYNISAEKGLPQAINNLGFLYEKGLGTTRDLDKAFSLYKKASEQGNELAMNNFGWSLINGYGTPADFVKGLDFISRSASSGNIRAVENLIKIYSNGEHIIPNTALEEYWLNKYDSIDNEMKLYQQSLSGQTAD